MSMSYRWALGSVLVLGLLVFAFLFAVNSTVHSFFIVLYSHHDHAAMDMGFYYMANAGGRLVGTLLSGVLYEYTGQQFGISVCLWVATFFMVAAALPTINLGPPEPEGDPQEATGREGDTRKAAVDLASSSTATADSIERADGDALTVDTGSQRPPQTVSMVTI
jgi:MFS family permease